VLILEPVQARQSEDSRFRAETAFHKHGEKMAGHSVTTSVFFLIKKRRFRHEKFPAKAMSGQAWKSLAV